MKWGAGRREHFKRNLDRKAENLYSKKSRESEVKYERG